MRRVALIYNPASGQQPARRAAVVANVAAVLKDSGVEVSVIPTISAESIGAQVQDALNDGRDTIIVCAGDGTVHHVLQTTVGTSAALGVIPLGTANALAMDLGLPRSPEKAAKMLLSAVPVQVSVGRVSYRGLSGNPGSRFFIVAAGIGADAFFFSRLDSRSKQRHGYMHYLMQAVRLLATHTFPGFAAIFSRRQGQSRSEEVSQVLAVRVTNFGGLVGNLVPGAAIGQDTLKVIAFKTRSRLRYVRFMLTAGCGRAVYSSNIEVVECTTVECRELENSTEPIFVEADGEVLGTLPAKLEVIPGAVKLLMPRK